jgi:hypothetical protein
MTGRNPNVFYEVGYAHALGKIVVLLTQDVNDIPFDFKHRQHIVYGGQIDTLRKELSAKLQWAINESKKGRTMSTVERFSLMLAHLELREGQTLAPPVIEATSKSRDFELTLRIRNDGLATIPEISHVYLFAESTAAIVPSELRSVIGRGVEPAKNYFATTTYNLILGQSGETVETPLDPIPASPIDAYDGLAAQYRLEISFPALPPGAVELTKLRFMFRKGSQAGDSNYRLRLHTESQFYEYTFRLAISLEEPGVPPTERALQRGNGEHGTKATESTDATTIPS